MSQEEWHSDFEITDELVRVCLENQLNMPLAVNSLKCVGEGWDNKAYLVNDAIIFRFPRRDFSATLIERENIILNNIHDRFNIEIPKPEYIGKPSVQFPYVFHGYPIIKGQSGCYANLTDTQRAASIKPLARFLRTLHNIDEEEALSFGAQPQFADRSNTEQLINTLTERVSKICSQQILNINMKQFQNEMDKASANILDIKQRSLIHGDLYCRHLMFDDKKLSGIIDWGDTGINHPSIDLSVIYSFYPASCHADFFNIYGEVDSKSLTHARFIALYIMLTVCLYSHDIKDDTLFAEVSNAVKRINPNLIT